MRNPLVPLAGCCLLSVLLYLVTFVGILHKPLTTGTVLQLAARRAEYVARHPGPKIIIIAGSNGLYSFRCETIARVVGRPCVNLSIGAQAGLNYDIIRVERLLGPHDVVLMPYEFEIYSNPASMLYGGLSNQMMVQYDQATLATLPAGRIVQSVFSFDVQFALEAITESAFAAAGVTGNFTPAAFTPEGDYAIGDARTAKHYADSLRQQDMDTPPDDVLMKPSGAQVIMKAFFAVARERNATVIGTLPTTFDDRPHNPAAIARIAAFYRNNGAQFLVLPNQDQYPRACFLDSHYHLAELCQLRHSRLVGEMLAAFLAHLPRAAGNLPAAGASLASTDHAAGPLGK